MRRRKTNFIEIIRNKTVIYRRLLNADKRALPDFLIVGTAKGGTTSFFNYLIQHPQIESPLKKEIHFFDRHFHKGINWYKMHFPVSGNTDSPHKRFITGEATPYYISHPLTAMRIKSVIPDVKLIVLLRNPVDRAYSNYKHMVRMGFEKETFEKAIELENSRTQGESEKIIILGNYYSFKHHHYSYLKRSHYYDELVPWLNIFKRDQILIIQSEALYSNPEPIYKKTLEYLGVEVILPENFSKFNSGGDYQPLAEPLRSQLIEYFKPHNHKLFELIGTTYNWE